MKERAPSAVYEYNEDAPQSKRKQQIPESYDEIDLVSEYLREIREHPLLTRDEEKSTAETIEMGTAAHLFHQALSTLIPNSNIQNGEHKDTFLSLGTAQKFIVFLNVNESVKPIIAESPHKNEGAKEKPLAREVTGFEINDDIFEFTTDFSSLEKFLREQMEMGEKARNSMINSNLRLVVHIAKRYVVKSLPLLDLIQEGNIGLMKAVGKFNVHRGNRFSTCAIPWIKQSISRGIYDKATIVVIPAYIHNALARLTKAEGELPIELGRQPTVSEIAESLKIPEEKVQELLHTKAMKNPASLDIKAFAFDDGNNDLSPLVNFIPSDSDTAEEAITEVLKQETREFLGSCLTEREKRVLELRLGLEDCGEQTLEQVGREFGVTREWIRQIEAKALDKLRTPSTKRVLEH